jgi:hypothetical protein
MIRYIVAVALLTAAIPAAAQRPLVEGGSAGGAGLD